MDSNGENNIISFAVTEASNQTVFEFNRALDTGDSRDKTIKNHDTKIIWATGETDDWTQKHNVADSFTVNSYETYTETILSTESKQGFLLILKGTAMLLIIIPMSFQKINHYRTI